MCISIDYCPMDPDVVTQKGVECTAGLVPYVFGALDRKFAAWDAGHEACANMCATNCGDGL